MAARAPTPTAPPRSLAGRALVSATAAHARVAVVAQRTLAAADGFVAGVADAALTFEEKAALGAVLYDSSPFYKGERGLFDWEERWFDADLPREPGRVLVAACGAGRELVAIGARGHAVEGFDPAPSMVALAASRASAARVWQATFAEWVAAPDERYDAILIGWGALSHVLDPDERRALLAACRRRCPAGPTLLSYWPRPTLAEGASPPRARALGVRLGRRLARSRDADCRATGDPFQPGIGFSHPYAEEELDALACAAGFELLRRGGAGDYPHATLR
ncbi:MAG: methyltransferase domain-containing protein [Myxococcales bacterium]|nr:methyltransferase domain-containing protein [Myxococcales bacterium]MCB9520255.1 methyltransferase domain-containing protein [Myxococcales bacterium]MCB9531377.1 methyltransferase domain-containing protein [Myxococcales bacterium]MCB9533550.1 methyltransferase domain-containing protein [Myxococcales bacterium]